MFKLIVLSVFFALVVCDYSCVFPDPFNLGKFYDLRDLGLKDHRLRTKSTDFTINVCNPLESGPCTKTDGCSVCDSKSHSCIGSLDSATALPLIDQSEGLILTFMSGSQTAEIEFTCDDYASLGEPVFVGENPPGYFSFTWNSIHGCRTDRCRKYLTCGECAAHMCDYCSTDGHCFLSSNTTAVNTCGTANIITNILLC